ncbi:BlaI/MecI/CopY family transcriptional regulator [Salsuginibacillus halophilus]|uniref:BlaI/MecI/CopY family transcriptional regulator n=1 Tax=Salsuginibacillus halophilus TaxID=517424 RepID=UPI000D0D02F3
MLQHLVIHSKARTFLARLTEKRIVQTTRIGRANHYEPYITKQQYRNAETQQFIDDVHKGSVSGLLHTLCNNGDLTKDDIESLMKRLKE